MAGTITGFRYVSDNGQEFKIRMDDSNGRAVGNTVTTANLPGLPTRLRPRMLHFQVFDAGTQKLHKRSIIVCERANPRLAGPSTANLMLFQQTTATNVSWRSTGYTGESRTF